MLYCLFPNILEVIRKIFAIYILFSVSSTQIHTMHTIPLVHTAIYTINIIHVGCAVNRIMVKAAG